MTQLRLLILDSDGSIYGNNCNDQLVAWSRLTLIMCLFEQWQIVHLKRFQFVNHRWIKSHKAVQFPYTDLDMTTYLAAIPCETILRHRELKNNLYSSATLSDSIEDDTPSSAAKHSSSTSSVTITTPSSSITTSPSTTSHSSNLSHPPKLTQVDIVNGNESTRKRLESTSLITHPVRDEDLIDFHQHRLLPGYQNLDIAYNLYAAVVTIQNSFEYWLEIVFFFLLASIFSSYFEINLIGLDLINF